jgi:hypothetical protein
MLTTLGKRVTMSKYILVLFLLYATGVVVWSAHQSRIFNSHHRRFKQALRLGDSAQMDDALQKMSCTRGNLVELNPHYWVKYWTHPTAGPCDESDRDR